MSRYKTYEDIGIRIEVDLLQLVLLKPVYTVSHFLNGLRFYDFYNQIITDMNVILYDVYNNKDFLSQLPKARVKKIECMIKYTDKALGKDVKKKKVVTHV